jgi:ribosome biogenesis GTPase / thiamine phosphate phosphatase
MQTGLVIKTTGSHMVVRDGDHALYTCTIRGKIRLDGLDTTHPVAVGDVVDFLPSKEAGKGVIYRLHDRKNYLIRKSNKLSSRGQIIASNLDQVVIVATLAFPRTSRGFVDRILLTAEAYHIPAVILFNKLDLHDSDLNEDMAYWQKVYESLGYTVMSVSAHMPDTLQEFKLQLAGKRSLFCGHSGVGKSSLINALSGSSFIKTAALSSQHIKGKHTTTFAEMHSLPDGIDIVDTPGIRDFGIIDVEKEEIGHFFPEIRQRISGCRFNNCLHVNEPDCAIVEAFETGEIDPERYYNYRGLLEDHDIFR